MRSDQSMFSLIKMFIGFGKPFVIWRLDDLGFSRVGVMREKDKHDIKERLQVVAIHGFPIPSRIMLVSGHVRFGSSSSL